MTQATQVQKSNRKIVKAIAFDADVLREVDRQASMQGTNRSSFVNRLLFAYLLVGKMQQKKRRASDPQVKPRGTDIEQ